MFHKDFVIKGKDDGQVEGPPNFEKPTVVQKDSGYDLRIPSHMDDKNRDRMVGKVGTTNPFHNIPLIVKFDIVVGGDISNDPFRYGPMRNHHNILVSYGEYSQETNWSSPNGDNDVSGILYDMLTKSQGHKENNDHVHEYVEADVTITKDGGIDNHDQTLNEEVISKNENFSKEYRLITIGTRSIKDMSAHI